jgi:hypothetical protein
MRGSKETEGERRTRRREGGRQEGEGERGEGREGSGERVRKEGERGERRGREWARKRVSECGIEEERVRGNEGGERERVRDVESWFGKSEWDRHTRDKGKVND